MADTQPVYFKGKDLFLSLNGVMVGCDTSCSIEFTTKTFDNSSKCTVDANGNLFGSNIVTMVTVKFTGSGFTVLDASESGGAAGEYSTGKLMQLCINQTKCFASYQRGGQFYGADVYVSSIKETAKFDEIASYDYELSSASPLFQISPS